MATLARGSSSFYYYVVCSRKPRRLQHKCFEPNQTGRPLPSRHSHNAFVFAGESRVPGTNSVLELEICVQSFAISHLGSSTTPIG